MLLNKTYSDDMIAKDAVLNELARRCNIAQFVSFSPGIEQRYAWVTGRPPNEEFASLEEACEILLNAAESKAVNVRSFRPGETKGQRLIQNLQTPKSIADVVRERAASGYFTIANELIPLDDGGVSGVAMGDIIEFAPADTPKCVEKPGVASLPRRAGTRLLELVYGFKPEIEFGRAQRVEFSLHPIRRGIQRRHTIIWELEPAPNLREVLVGKWPNRFSKFIGDKAYGLLVAHLLGFPVPRTLTISRNLAPFEFGKPTGTAETWIRTAPFVPIAGKYPTYYGWSDPYKMMHESDPSGETLPSILAQESVDFVYSGAAQTADSGAIIEGKSGRGDSFMTGQAKVDKLPADVRADVLRTHDALSAALAGAIKFEWVWDGSSVWIVQLHRRAQASSVSVIYPGHAKTYISFDASDGLDKLRELILGIKGKNVGVIVEGEVGVTSHVGDILREAKIPSYLRSADPDAEPKAVR